MIAGEKNAPSLAARGKSTFFGGWRRQRVCAINEINAQLMEILPKNCCGATLLQRLYDLNMSFVN